MFTIGMKTVNFLAKGYPCHIATLAKTSFATKLTSSFLEIQVQGKQGSESVDVCLKVPWMAFPEVTTTAYTALEKAVLYHPDKLNSFESKFWGNQALGYELVAFNGIEADSSCYWKFSVDGEVSEHYGASFYVLSAFSKDYGHTTIKFELTCLDTNELSTDRHESHPCHANHPRYLKSSSPAK